MQTRGSKVEVKCKYCGDNFMARVADRKRGWGKFCSKSCKAIKQSQKRYEPRIVFGSSFQHNGYGLND